MLKSLICYLLLRRKTSHFLMGIKVKLGSVVKSEFESSAIGQPSMVHEVTKFDEVEIVDTMVLYEDQEKVVSFAKLMPHIDLVIFDDFSDVAECKFSL